MPETEPIALIGEKLDATPTWRANCRNKISAIIKGGGYQARKVDGFGDKDLYRFRPSYSRSNTLLLSGDESAECVIDCINWKKDHAPAHRPLLI